MYISPQENTTISMKLFFSYFAIALALTACSTTEPTAQGEGSSQNNQTADTTDPFDFMESEFYNEEFIRNYDHIYKDNIKTARLYNEGYERSYPMIELNSGQRLKLSFDDLHADYKTYSFSIIHCNADWKPSGLMPQEYIEGFTEEVIDNYKFSFNTLKPYTHYNLTFPNDYLKFKKTGNYLLHVSLNYNDENLILTKRFRVYENKVEVEGNVVKPTIVKDMESKQEVDFTIHHAGYQIENPYGNLKVVLMQNNRWDNAIRDLKPVFVKNKELVYDHQGKNTFYGANEFRKIDITSFRYSTENIMKIEEGPEVADVYLKPDQSRSHMQYLSNRDINGNFVIERKEGDKSEVEADYARVHFTLEYESPVNDGNLYVFGRLSDWQFKEEFKLVYDQEKKAYTTTALLKQGYYDYAYVFLPDGKNAGDLTRIEGTHEETENNYTVLIYHRPNNEDYDKLIGVKQLNSVRD